MRVALSLLILMAPLFGKVGSVTLELTKTTLRVFIEGKFEYTIKRVDNPPKLTIYIPNEKYRGPTQIVEKGVQAKINVKSDGTYIDILPGVGIKSYEDYWGAGYLVVLINLKGKPRPRVKPTKTNTYKKVTSRTVSKVREVKKGGERFFIYSNGAPRYLIYKALSRLTGESYPSLDTSRVFLKGQFKGLQETLSKLQSARGE